MHLILLSLLFSLASHSGGPNGLECCWDCDEELSESVPESMRPAYDQARGNVVKLSVTRWEEDEKGKRRFRTESGVGVLLDPSKGDVIADRRLIEGAERITVRFVGQPAFMPRRASFLGSDEEAGLSVVRGGPVDIDCIAMPAALVSTQHGKQQDALLISYHHERDVTWATVGKIGCVRDPSALGGRRVTLTHGPDSLLAPGGLVSSPADGRPLAWVVSDSSALTRSAGTASTAGPDHADQESSELPPIELDVISMLTVAEAFERIVCAHADDPSREFSGPGKVWMGISADLLDEEVVRHHLGLTGPAIVVRDVFRDSPALRAGLCAHHILVSCNGKDFENEWDLGRVLKEASPGDVLRLGVIKAGKRTEVELTLGSW